MILRDGELLVQQGAMYEAERSLAVIKWKILMGKY